MTRPTVRPARQHWHAILLLIICFAFSHPLLLAVAHAPARGHSRPQAERVETTWSAPDFALDDQHG